jgi:hypothetical protein
MRTNNSLTVAEKLAAGGLLSLRKEFCSWAWMCPVTAYKEIPEGRLKVVKIGRKTMVAAQDALAYSDALRGIAA